MSKCTAPLLRPQSRQRPHADGFALSAIRAVFSDGNRWVVELVSPSSLRHPEVHCGRFPAVFLDLELDLLTFIERSWSGALDGGDVHEDIPASTTYGLNETIALLRVEPLHRTARHCRIS
jgi:hypothetical protein